MTPPTAADTSRTRAGLHRAIPGTRNRDAQQVFAELLLPRSWGKLRAITDVLCLGIAATIALFAAPHTTVTSASRWSTALFPLVAFLLLRMRRAPDEQLSASLLDTLGYVVGMLSVAAMLTIAGDGVFGGEHPGPLAVRLWAFSAVYVGASRAALVMIRRGAMRTPAYATPVLIVGAGYVGQQIARRLAAEPRWGLRAVGFVDDSPRLSADGAPLGLPLLGGLEDLPAATEMSGARRLIIAFSGEPDRALLEQLRDCEAQGIEVSVVPRLYESINERATLDHLGGVPLVSLRPTDPRGWEFAVKHSIDRVSGLAAVLLLAPLLGVIALAIKLSSPGPVLFRQRRVGRDGHEFDLLKFRSMAPAPPGESFVPADGDAPGGVEGVDRRTAVGRLLRRTSLDELPQLLNVLRGDMSLVGPRPERPEFVARFAVQHERYEDRHRVKSGITGWSQVNGLRGQTSIADRVEWDNWYIRNWSLRLDLRILFLTVLAVLRPAE
jgi:exopolysaccharide biosynthesis polyprenyl glycosylphosphotransferase